MPGLRSVTAGGRDTAKSVAEKVYPAFASLFPAKFYWFLSHGEGAYKPHEWQAAFHSANKDGKLLRFRHLVAGRRGGKTFSAAWEVLFYCLFPEQYHMDRFGKQSSRPLWVWVLAKDHEVGFPAKQAFLESMDKAGLIPGKDYRYNKTEKKIEFENGTLVQFKSADDAQSLRGAGLDILWIDEAAFVPSREAWDVVRPALSDKLGMLVTTTTPKGKNWFYKEFWSEQALKDDNQFRVEYTSVDNPYLVREEWEYARSHLHPIIFKQEYMAAFDAMAGVELPGDWLHYYSLGDPEPDQIRLPMIEGRFAGRKFMAVDPAISLADTADHFAMALIGITEDNSQAFLLDTYLGRIDFPDQIDLIKEWFLKYRPEYIGIESNAYQRALAVQSARMEGLPPIVPTITKAKKHERILSMSPLFKIGKVRIHSAQRDFIEQWVSYDSTKKNPEDDLLDAVESALAAAGVLLPAATPVEEPRLRTLDDEAQAQIRQQISQKFIYDEELGSEA